MLWAGGNIKEWFWAFVIVVAIGIVSTSLLRAAGWPWWARVMITIPIVAVAARIANRVLANTLIIF
jgi:Na+-driven multidrug efflux pump